MTKTRVYVSKSFRTETNEKLPIQHPQHNQNKSGKRMTQPLAKGEELLPRTVRISLIELLKLDLAVANSGNGLTNALEFLR